MNWDACPVKGLLPSQCEKAEKSETRSARKIGGQRRGSNGKERKQAGSDYCPRKRTGNTGKQAQEGREVDAQCWYEPNQQTEAFKEELMAAREVKSAFNDKMRETVRGGSSKGTVKSALSPAKEERGKKETRKVKRALSSGR